jgi:hypothetical protein
MALCASRLEESPPIVLQTHRQMGTPAYTQTAGTSIVFSEHLQPDICHHMALTKFLFERMVG